MGSANVYWLPKPPRIALSPLGTVGDGNFQLAAEPAEVARKAELLERAQF